MHSHSLIWRSVLIVEDEPLIALDIVQAIEVGGAQVKSARTLLARNARICKPMDVGQ